MFEFIKAALPWIAMGLVIILFAVSHAKNKKAAEENDGKVVETHQTDGMCIGMCIGVALGTTNVCSLGTGMCFGMLIGMVVGMNIKK